MSIAELIKKNPIEKLEQQKIGEGTYRNTYFLDQEYCIKLLKNTHHKDYGFFTINYNTKTYVRAKFGIHEFNIFEYDQYHKFIKIVPEELAPLFEPIHSIISYNNNPAIIQRIVKNYDGSTAQPLNVTGKLSSSMFYDRLNQLESFFITQKIKFFNIKPDNILVKKINETDSIPVIYDFKRIGIRTYPFQFQLILNSFAIKKLKRRFARLKEFIDPSVI